MRAWHIVRWVVLVLWALALCLLVVRGPEDAWVRDASGAWVAHGHPAGPPPTADYQPPMSERFLPVTVLALTLAALVFGAFFTRRTPTSRDALNRSIRYFGAVSVIATVLAISLGLVLLGGLWSGLGPALDDPGVMVLCLVGAAFLLKLLSWHADGTRRLLEAHYDLKRATSLLQDTVERLAAVQDKGSAHSG